MDVNPPIYYLVAHYSLIVFGFLNNPLVAIRIPSAIAGILTVPVMYFLSKELWPDFAGREQFAYLCTAITIIASQLVFYSDFGRSYALAVLLFSLCIYYFVRTWNKSGEWYLFALFGILSVYTHLYTAIPFGFMVLFLLLNNYPFRRMAGIKTVLASSIPFIPLLLYIPYMLGTRSSAEVTYGLTLIQMGYMVPLELFSFAAPIFIPAIILWLWYYHDSMDILLCKIGILTFCTGLVLSFFTPIIAHYFLPLTLPLMVIGLKPLYYGLSTKWKYVSAILILSIIAAFAQQVMMLWTVVRIGI